MLAETTAAGEHTMHSADDEIRALGVCIWLSYVSSLLHLRMLFRKSVCFFATLEQSFDWVSGRGLLE